MDNQKNNKVLITLLLVIIVMLSTLCVLFATGIISFNSNRLNDNDTNENESIYGNYKVLIENKSVDEGILNNVLDIIGIPYYNNNSNACLTDIISVSNYSENAKKIMSFYIDSHNHVKIERPDDNIYNSKECGIGAADCYTISKEDAKKLFDMFNFDGKITDYFQESVNLKNDYIFWYEHTLGLCDKKISHDIVAEYSSEEKKNEYGINIGADIKIEDKQLIENEKTTRTIIYIFKPSTNGTYYLDNVNVK